ncbi:MAG: rhombotarget lipoprotein [Steroidobacterales bacterium]
MRSICTRLGICMLATGGLAGCAGLGGLCFLDCGASRAGTTPLVSYLYPDGSVPASDSTPVLKVPLTVGLAFLPEQPGATGIGASDKDAILSRLRERFRTLDYVRDIVVIPDYYLPRSKGYEGLAQLARLQNLDVIALVSYDQVAKRDENKRSLAYLTIVGAYLVRGSHSETSTLLDLAVVEPSSRSLLLRAGGTSFSSGSSTAVEQGEELRQQSRHGLDLATDELVAHLDRELTLFSERVRAGSGPVKVVRRGQEGAGGGGAITWTWLLLLAGLPALSRGCRCGAPHP